MYYEVTVEFDSAQPQLVNFPPNLCKYFNDPSNNNSGGSLISKCQLGFPIIRRKKLIINLL